MQQNGGLGTFAAGAADAALTQTVTLTITDNTDVDPDETFTVSLPTAAPGTGYAVSGSDSGVPVTITDDDYTLEHSTLHATSPVLVSSGRATSVATLTTRDNLGREIGVGGASVAIHGFGFIDGLIVPSLQTSLTRDNGDGTYIPVPRCCA